MIVLYKSRSVEFFHLENALHSILQQIHKISMRCILLNALCTLLLNAECRIITILSGNELAMEPKVKVIY